MTSLLQHLLFMMMSDDEWRSENEGFWGSFIFSLVPNTLSIEGTTMNAPLREIHIEELLMDWSWDSKCLKCLKRHMNIEHQWKEEASWQQYINHLIVVGNHSNILPSSSRVPNKRAWGKIKIVGGLWNRDPNNCVQQGKSSQKILRRGYYY